MSKKNERPIIIKRIVKKSDGHHGGAWKVAYADFMTAMMAFFLLLWILSNSDEEKLKGLADFFNPDTVPLVNIGGADVLKGESMSEADLVAVQQGSEGEIPDSKTELKAAEISPNVQDEPSDNMPAPTQTAVNENPWAELAESQLAVPEQELGGMTAENIESLEENLASFSENIRVHEKNGNIAIEVLDLQDRPMFRSGSAELNDENMDLIRTIVESVARIDGKLQVTGHTDATPFRGSGGYSNWELSADRANAVRKVMHDLGISTSRILRVAGAAELDPIDQGNPKAAINRRVTIEIIGAGSY